MFLDMKSFVRQAPCEERDKHPNTAQQRLWLDMSQVDGSNLHEVDDKYNSNMWKNFRFVRARSSTVGTNKTRDSIEALIADSYPLKLPKPSRIGESSYQKYLEEVKLAKKKRHAIEFQLEGKQKFEKRHLKIRSECRAPPTDWEGNILPPDGFRLYPRPPKYFEESEDYFPLPYTYPMYTPTPTPSYSRSGTPWRYGLRVRRHQARWITSLSWVGMRCYIPSLQQTATLTPLWAVSYASVVVLLLSFSHAKLYLHWLKKYFNMCWYKIRVCIILDIFVRQKQTNKKMHIWNSPCLRLPSLWYGPTSFQEIYKNLGNLECWQILRISEGRGFYWWVF